VWIAAEAIGLSGILTMVAFAMTVARRTGPQLPARMRVPIFAVWETVVFVLNAFAFVLIGMQLRPIWGRLAAGGTTGDAIMTAWVVLAVTIAARFAWVMGYGALRRWPPADFRATLQGYFLPASLMGMLGYWAAGLWTTSVSRYYLVSLPAVLLAIALGRVINRRLDARRFLVWVHAVLLASGAGLVLQAIVTWIARQPPAG